MSADEPHYVYRCFDARGCLLYIGCTVDVRKRLNKHFSDRTKRASVYLAAHMLTHEAVEYPDRATALLAERAAIIAEAPLLNEHHNMVVGVSEADLEARIMEMAVRRSIEMVHHQLVQSGEILVDPETGALSLAGEAS